MNADDEKKLREIVRSYSDLFSSIQRFEAMFRLAKKDST